VINYQLNLWIFELTNQLASSFFPPKENLITVFTRFQVQEFANGFTAIREMGFPTNAVADALFMFENDTDKALAHLLHGSS